MPKKLCVELLLNVVKGHSTFLENRCIQQFVHCNKESRSNNQYISIILLQFSVFLNKQPTRRQGVAQVATMRLPRIIQYMNHWIIVYLNAVSRVWMQ